MAASRTSGTFVTIRKQLSMGLWPWTSGVRSRLPLHYKKRYCEKFMAEPVPVHHKPDPRKWTVDEFGVRTRVEERPIPVVYPSESHEGLWGGEGIIDGFKRKKRKKYKPWNPISPYIWKPVLMKRVLYSEILDKHLEITVTPRTLDLVDEAHGFDNYILKTREIDLKSRLGMKLKREMLLVLSKKSLYADNPEKREEIYRKYKKFLIPEEEISWLGLTLNEADIKQMKLEEAKRDARPLKETYMEELVKKLKANELDEYKSEHQESWLQKLNPFEKVDDKESNKQ